MVIIIKTFHPNVMEGPPGSKMVLYELNKKHFCTNLAHKCQDFLTIHVCVKSEPKNELKVLQPLQKSMSLLLAPMTF